MVSFQHDQAAGLRRMFGGAATRVMAFCGSAGSGKTSMVVNLAATLAARGMDVLIIDENPAPDNAVTASGAIARFDLLQAVNRDCALARVTVDLSDKVRILPASRAVQHMARFTGEQQRGLLEHLETLGRPADVVLIDAADGSSGYLSPLALAAEDIILVATPGAVDITDTYARLKRLVLTSGPRRFRLLLNKAKDADSAAKTTANLQQVAHAHLGVRIDLAGWIPFDEQLRHAGRLCQPIHAAFPAAGAVQALAVCAGRLITWPAPVADRNGLEHFLRRLLQLIRALGTPSPVDVIGCQQPALQVG